MAAIISPCGMYRYRLDRPGPGPGGPTTVIMVNPSTADADKDDATIKKLRGFGLFYGWGDLIVGNLFAYRATDVRALNSAMDPVGPGNIGHLELMIMQARQVIFAWGAPGKFPHGYASRFLEVDRVARAFGHTPYCLGPLTKDGHPKHPLMLPYSARPCRLGRPTVRGYP